ncbi:spore coat protein CotY [Barrientosiimonas marina]|uniref:CotY/CotZ family spore coat protein n=1 Tax=Lentibacillus kimchii TaxID=1542911 RepID=A0ABW2USB4_9BACI
MGCGKDHRSGNCVCDVLKEIEDAQQDVVENCCSTSCEKSINDLLGESDGGGGNNGLDTVPVILYCGDGCEPFKGYGANPNDVSNMTSSFYFRVKKIDENCCAVVELLRDPHDDNESPHDPIHQYTKHLCATGICITVDLDCFCHVTCLPAINAFR